MTKLFNGTRRSFLQLSLATLASTAVTPAFAVALPHVRSMRELAIHNLHTEERLRVTYWKDGKYDRAALAKINHLMRDHYSGDSFPIDPRLMDLMYDLQNRVKNDHPVELVSGYRSPKTNMMLASYSDGVAKKSFHTKGMAMDIRLPGTSLAQLHDTALAMKRGGVGYYPDSQFVHIDVGPLRRW
jgi:uncharacterized protein YcbK (DUF882 family)